MLAAPSAVRNARWVRRLSEKPAQRSVIERSGWVWGGRQDARPGLAPPEPRRPCYLRCRRHAARVRAAWDARASVSRVPERRDCVRGPRRGRRRVDQGRAPVRGLRDQVSVRAQTDRL